jgi:hypothetical protein
MTEPVQGSRHLAGQGSSAHKKGTLFFARALNRVVPPAQMNCHLIKRQRHIASANMAKIREHCNTWVQTALDEPGQSLQPSLFDADPDFDLSRIRY